MSNVPKSESSVLARLLVNSRFYILIFSALGAVALWLVLPSFVPGSTLQTIRLEQIYGFLALAFLYLALIIGPLSRLWSGLPGRAGWLHARRAIGVACFGFALLHSSIAFWGQLGGFGGLSFLTPPFLWSLALGGFAMVILLLLTITSLDIAVKFMTPRYWKWLHRLIYGASIAIVIHVLLIGTHYISLNAPIGLTSYGLLAFLLVLEAITTDRLIRKHWPRWPASLLLITLVGLFGLSARWLWPSSGATNNLSVHAAHLQAAAAAQQNSQVQSNIPGLTGDKNKRYSVSFDHAAVSVGQPATLTFRIFDASSGNPVTDLQTLYDKKAHLVIVDQTLTSYQHIHPTLSGNALSIDATFPTAGRYHLYLNYQPPGAIEQQVGYTLDVGTVDPSQTASQPIDTNLTKAVDGYRVTISGNSYKASDLSFGQTKLSFMVADSNGQPVTTLKPYLAAFGHLVLINEKTYDYIHVHPSTTVVPTADASAGPTVDFIPLGLYGPIQPGTYRIFIQLNPNNQLITTDFTVEVK
jgi:DMSO/TMAO reductase YedYZ heme-binding membrane subunit